MPQGQISGPRNAFQVGANDQLFDAAAFKDAIIAYRNGAPVDQTICANASVSIAK